MLSSWCIQLNSTHRVSYCNGAQYVNLNPIEKCSYRETQHFFPYIIYHRLAYALHWLGCKSCQRVPKNPHPRVVDRNYAGCHYYSYSSRCFRTMPTKRKHRLQSENYSVHRKTLDYETCFRIAATPKEWLFGFLLEDHTFLMHPERKFCNDNI